MQMQNEKITFSFGENWRSFVDTVSDGSIKLALSDIERWLGPDTVIGKTILDIGSGSGIHSLCFHRLGAKEISSFDLDPYSVESTRLLWGKAGSPANWKVSQGSILDQDFVAGIDKHQIVYSWGVLHHTGSMWQAIKNACSLVEKGGLLWIAIYVKGPSYEQDLKLKRSYNQASRLGKKIIEWKEISKFMRQRWKAGKNPFAWNEKRGRGMDAYHDLLDWLGGLPYEVASADEVISFCEGEGFTLKKVDDREANIVYLFSRER
jgi:2-polyprenyl-3-methyl-5-hydroxy-6-metoxy-1,4-benzoquinol methylase